MNANANYMSSKHKNYIHTKSNICETIKIFAEKEHLEI